MKIEEAIEHCKEKARECEGQCGQDHKQLAEWLAELILFRNAEEHAKEI